MGTQVLSQRGKKVNKNINAYFIDFEKAFKSVYYQDYFNGSFMTKKNILASKFKTVNWKGMT